MLCTHQLQYLSHADKILVLDKFGNQAFWGTYSQLSSRHSEFDIFDSKNGLSVSENVTKVVQENVDSNCHRDNSRYSLELSLDYRKRRNESEGNGVHILKEGKIVINETKIEGRFSFQNWFKYLSAGGYLGGFWIFFLSLFVQVNLMVVDYWPRWWASETYGSQSRTMYLWIYAILVAGAVFVSFSRATAWFSFTQSASNSKILNVYNNI